MRNKKNSKNQKTPEQEALERHVDAIMDPKQPDPQQEEPQAGSEPAVPEPAVPVESPVPEEMPASEPALPAKTAPVLSARLRKKIPVDHEPEDETTAKPETPPPLSIDKLDNLTENMTEPESAGSAGEPDDSEPTQTDGIEGSADLEDGRTEKAVDDIVAHEGDVMLALQDAATKPGQAKRPKNSGGWKSKLRNLAKNKKLWLAVILLLLVLFAIPATRYKLLGLVIKKQLVVIVTDSKTTTPVSSATVNVAGRTAKTDANGKAALKVPPGQTRLNISKKYYKTSNKPLFVGLKAVSTKVQLQATGRQVPVTVLNKLTGQPLNSAEVKVLGTASKTNKSGKAIIVLPADSATAAATISLNGYNTAKVTLTITDQTIPANSFSLTPVGSVYFLSNASGRIDVVKADLGGDNRRTVLPGTGREEANSTSLLASRDWRYVVLKSRRETPVPALYLIDTKTDKVTQFESSNANIRLIGWYDHSFAYAATRIGVPAWQPGRETIKSYDAHNQQLNQIDQNQADGNAAAFAYQNFLNFYILDSTVMYTTQWASQTSDGSYDFAGKTNAIRSVQFNGQGKKDYQSFPANAVNSIQAVQYSPKGIYYAVYDGVTGRPSYYSYQDHTVRPASITQDDIARDYPTYLVSPSGNQTFWTELRDGKNSLLIGDTNARNARVVANLSNYNPYGWHSDNYVLVSKNNSELYILPTRSKDPKPFKITDYYKPAQTYTGYGYGYGGL